MTRRAWFTALVAGLLASLWPAVRGLLIPGLWRPCEVWDGRSWRPGRFDRLRAGEIFRVPPWVFSWARGEPERAAGDSYLEGGVWSVQVAELTDEERRRALREGSA
jgi:hypothetical protein